MDFLLNILALPERCLVNKKITKAFFKRNFDLTSAEKDLLNDPIIVASIDWLASISHANSNIPHYADGLVSFEEVQVISVKTMAADFDKNNQRIAELVQKHIPYHILLCIYNDEYMVLNTCDKRINQNDNSKRTIERRYFSEDINYNCPSQAQQEFVSRLIFAQVDKTNLRTFYESYSQEIISLQAAAVTGVFLPRTNARSVADMQHLEQMKVLEKEIMILEKRLKKETQLATRVEMNTQIQGLKHKIEHLKRLITA